MNDQTKIKMTEEKLPDEEVKIKMSLCGTCDGIVRVAVEHMMDGHSKNSFGKEVVEHNLSVKTMPLLDYREENPDWCSCKK